MAVTVRSSPVTKPLLLIPDKLMLAVVRPSYTLSVAVIPEIVKALGVMVAVVVT